MLGRKVSHPEHGAGEVMDTLSPTWTDTILVQFDGVDGETEVRIDDLFFLD